MEYELKIAGNKIKVDGIEFGAWDGSSEGNIDLFIRVFDSEEDIYKKSLWIDWVNSCLGEKHNPAERIKDVIATISDGDGKCYRTITIKNACIASFSESSGGADFSYEVVIKRAPRKGDEKSVEVLAE